MLGIHGKYTSSKRRSVCGLFFEKRINKLEDEFSSSSNSCVLEQNHDETVARLAIKECESLIKVGLRRREPRKGAMGG